MPSIRADFSTAAWLAPESFEWVPSPQAGVDRVMLDRQGDEVAVATSLVRYAPGSRFPVHEHPLGEEYLVLEGEFGDEHGRYPPGTYVRNPPGSRHTPFADPGCIIWVKLRQFHPEDQRQVVTDLRLPLPRSGVVSKELHRFQQEVVTSIAAAAEAVVDLPPMDVVQELFVIDAAVEWRGRRLGARGWLRVPAGEGIKVRALKPGMMLHKTRFVGATQGSTAPAGASGQAEFSTSTKRALS